METGILPEDLRNVDILLWGGERDGVFERLAQPLFTFERQYIELGGKAFNFKLVMVMGAPH
ncbi:hypothetical protein D3C79_635080 [compost metagenome]